MFSVAQGAHRMEALTVRQLGCLWGRKTLEKATKMSLVLVAGIGV
jgi:hypothetical protein